MLSTYLFDETLWMLITIPFMVLVIPKLVKLVSRHSMSAIKP